MTKQGWWILGGVAAAVGVTAGVVIYRRSQHPVLPPGDTPDPNRALPPGQGQPDAPPRAPGFTLQPGVIPPTSPSAWRWLDRAGNVRTASGIDDLRMKLLKEWGNRQVASSVQVLFPGETEWHMASFKVFGLFDKFPSADPSSWTIDPTTWSERVRRGEELGPDVGPRLAPAPGSPGPTSPGSPGPGPEPEPPPGMPTDPLAEARRRAEQARKIAEQGKQVYDKGKQVIDFLSTLGVRR